MTRPKVSVMMITYNHEAFIKQALESVLMQQTNFDYEIVVGEDCSKDRTREILVDYQQRYPQRIRLLLHAENQGMMANFIQTYHACRGEYVALLEGDDYWTAPHKLQKQADFLDAHPDCAACCHNAYVIHEDNSNEMQILYAPGEVSTLLTAKDIMFMIQSKLPRTASFMSRCSVLSEFPDWFDKMLMADWPFFILHALQANISYSDEVMSAYRIHEGGIVSKHRQDKAGQTYLRLWHIKAAHILEKNLPAPYNTYAQAIKYDYYYHLFQVNLRQNDLHEAKKFVIPSLIGLRYSRSVSPIRLMRQVLYVYLPGLHWLVTRLKKNFQPTQVTNDHL